jgi:hypothetical protein
MAAILRAIHRAKIVILDLRSLEHLRPLQYTWALPTSFYSLRTLRIEVQVCDIFDFVATEPKSAFLEALKDEKDLGELVIKLRDAQGDSNCRSKREIVAAAVSQWSDETLSCCSSREVDVLANTQA